MYIYKYIAVKFELRLPNLTSNVIRNFSNYCSRAKISNKCKY